MSRVKAGNKWVNSTKQSPSDFQQSKVVRVHHPNEDYHKCLTLSAWLFYKYDMTYEKFSRKSRKRKDELRLEYMEDTYEARQRFEELHSMAMAVQIV